MTLTEKIKTILFEDTWNSHGSQYMSHPYEEQETTIQPELPIAPATFSSMQLTDTAPPVGDDEYEPANNKELGSALAMLALEVPDDVVPAVYQQIKNLVSDSAEQDLDGIDSTEELGESLSRFLMRINESWDEEDEGFLDDELDDADLDDEGNYTGPSSGEIPLKYLAQYYRDKPGKKQKGTGETTVINATGRTIENVLRPLFGVPKEQLADAVEYLRLQFKLLATQEFGMEKIPSSGPQTFQGMYFKKLIPKLGEDQLGDNFLVTVIQDFKRRNKRWLRDMVQKALAEVESEKAAYQSMKQVLEKEAPHLAKIW